MSWRRTCRQGKAAHARIVQHALRVIENPGLAEFEHEAVIGNSRGPERAFCSIIRIVTPLSRRPFQQAEGFLNQHGEGARWEGSSMSSNSDRAEVRVQFSSCFCWPPDRVEACTMGFFTQRGKTIQLPFDSLRHIGDVWSGADRAKFDIVAHRQFGKKYCGPAAHSRCGLDQPRGVQFGDIAAIEIHRSLRAGSMPKIV